MASSPRQTQAPQGVGYRDLTASEVVLVYAISDITGLGSRPLPAILEWRGYPVTVTAHFDGKVIVPDEPLDLRPNQALILQIEPLEGETEESALDWIAANAVDSDALPTDLADQHDHYLYGRPKEKRG
jgi:hypothetical protein